MNGSIRYKKSSIYLTIYSVGFARFLIQNKIDHVKIRFSELSAELFSGVQTKFQFERIEIGQPLTLCAVTKILPEETRKKLSGKKSLKIQVDVSKLVRKKIFELLKKNKYTYNFKHVDKKIEGDDKIAMGCYISCHRSKKGMWYRIAFRHKIFDEIVLKKNKIVFARDRKGNFFIRKREDGVFLNYSKTGKKGSGISYISLPEHYISPKEKELFASGRRAISFKSFISKKDFNLDISKYFLHSKERELAFELIRQKVGIRLPHAQEREADIVLEKSGNQIELTTISPVLPLQKNNAHGEGVHINARLCEGYLRVKTRQIKSYYLVIDKRWTEYVWVKKLMKRTENEVQVIGTDFQNDWAAPVAKIIRDGENI